MLRILVISVNISNSSVSMAGWLPLAILFGFPFLVLAGTEDQRNFRCYIEDFIVKPVAKDLIDVFTCTVSRPNNRSFINCNVRVNRNIYELDMESTMDMILPNNHMRRLYNAHFNACTFLVILHKTRLFHVIAKNFAKVFEGNVTCPVVAVSTDNY